MIDFTNCRTVPGRAYSGANGNKIAVRYNGGVYMLKFPPTAAKKPTDLSYSNGCISEHLGSSIFNMLGISAQETILGEYRIKGKKKLVCACKDFTTGGKRLLDFCSIKNTVLDSESNGSGTELEDVLDTIDKQGYLSPRQLTEHFWNMFVADAFLGNFDRHNGNWGFLYDDNDGEMTIAPVFDCGSCLLPQADEKTMQKVLSDEMELYARIYQFPTSALKQNGRKINYYDFLTKAENNDCNEAIKRVVPRIDMGKIERFVDGIEEISEMQKSFYKKYINARYQLILCPAYEIVCSMKQNRNQGQMTL